MAAAPQVFELRQYEAPAGGEPIVARPFYVGDDLVAVLVTMQPHARVPEHHHEHHDEIFDVVRGTGTFWLDGQAFSFGPGMTIVVPAGIPHALEAGEGVWVLRETVHRRIYAREAIKRAIQKRVPRRFLAWAP
ncbi:MAG TPA: cupin domain-containing protein [Anaerolineae bacterium]|nr:cupin domain-containing protein [Anaerolineae bacterium]